MLTLVHCDPETNKKRFYKMSLQPDLLGGVALVLEFGRIGESGRVMVITCPDEEDTIIILQKLKKAKEKKGYELKEISRYLVAILQRLEQAKKEISSYLAAILQRLEQAKEAKEIKVLQLKVLLIHLAALAAPLQKPSKPRRKKSTQLKEISISFDENELSPTMKGEDDAK